MEALTSQLCRIFERDNHPLTFISEMEMERGDAFRLAQLTFHTREGEAVRGFWCRPSSAAMTIPAVLVIHAHGERYDIGANELMHGRPALAGPLGPALAALGIATLCLDLPCFGDRSNQTESALAKARLWRGQSLAGQMLGECRSALDWLAARPDVQPGRIGVFGISMGATLGYWLAAVDPRVRALAQECCLADFRELVASGAHDLHGIYLTVPGLLNVAGNGTIAGLVAPRSQFVGLGELDPLTPPRATGPALEALRAAYANKGGRLVIHREASSGHVETPAMRAAVLEFLSEELA